MLTLAVDIRYVRTSHAHLQVHGGRGSAFSIDFTNTRHCSAAESLPTDGCPGGEGTVPGPPTPDPQTLDPGEVRPTRFLRMLGGGLFGCTRQQLTPSSVVVYKLQLTCISRTGRAERAGERQVLGALNYWHCCQDDVKLLTSSDSTLVHSWATRLEKRGKKKKEKERKPLSVRTTWSYLLLNFC